jgi:SNF2 family DNA or RNA helicase
MTAEIRMRDEQLILEDGTGLISGRHQSQLNYWGFRYDSPSKSFIALPENHDLLLDKLVAYLSRYGIPFALDAKLAAGRAEIDKLRVKLQEAERKGEALKNGDVSSLRSADFIRFLREKIPRKLKEHQIKAALHLLAVGNGANFSVPGSGKTTVVLTVFHWLRELGFVDALFVVGPPSSFGPWQEEFHAVLGAKPKVALLAGGNIDERHSKYFARKDSLCDLYLTSFQTLQRDWERVKSMFAEKGLKFFFIVDEAHYMKQVGGSWANAVLNVSQCAEKRCVLTGTPFPRTYSDAFNIFDVLWPRCSPLNLDDRRKIEIFAQKRANAEAIDLLQTKIGSLFYRVRKSDLGLAPQEFHEPISIEMSKHEKFVYDAIVDRLRTVSKEDFFRDVDLLTKLRRGRMMRLRQAISYSKLLGNAVLEYNEDLAEGNLALCDVLKHYDQLELPAKLKSLMKLVESLRQKDEKILIWSNFVETLKLICKHLEHSGHGVRLIYGETPTESSNVGDELTREKIIAEFVAPNSGIDILVANPAACAESISLHKTCSHAIYYDLSYNCAQYLQSLDRIHRVGGSENKVAHYHFLQYNDTIDSDILTNLRQKAQNMSAIIDEDYPIYSLDMFSSDDELEAYERLFGRK